MNSRNRLIWLLGVSLLGSSCERVKRLAGDVKEKVAAAGKSVADKAVTDDKPVDPVLQALVDGAGGTYRFRKDLPFPSSLVIRLSQREEYQSGRLLQELALGRQGVPLRVNLESVARFDLSSGRFALTVEKAPQVVLETNMDGTSAPPPPSPLEAGVEQLNGLTVRFEKSQTGWSLSRPDGGQDFKAVAWGKSIERHLEDLLGNSGAAPKKIWFSPRGRIAPGAVVRLRDDEVCMIGGAGSSGKLKLEFESVGALRGHPCGVFRISGDMNQKSVPAVDGTLRDLSWSITSGRVWLSLIYPVVLKEDLQMVQSAATGQLGGAMIRSEGSLHLVVEREWIPGGGSRPATSGR